MTAAAAGLIAGGAAQADDIRRFVVPIMDQAPAVDGSFNADEWTEAIGFAQLQNTGGTLEERTSRAYVGAHGDKIYFALLTELPAEGSLVANQINPSPDLAYDDSFEVFVNPTPGADKGVNYQVLGNSSGLVFYQPLPWFGGKPVDGWAGSYDIAQGAQDGFWVVEGAIPVASLVPGRGVADGEWGFSLCRGWKNPFVFSSTPVDYAGNKGAFTFEKGAPAVQFFFTEDPFQKEVKGDLYLKNTSDAQATYDVLISTLLDVMPENRLETQVTLAPGESTVVRYDASSHTRNCNAFDTTVRVSQGDRVFHDMNYVWETPVRKQRWTTVKEIILPFDFEFGIYPYHQAIRIHNILGNYKGTLPAEVQYTIVDAAGNTVQTYTVPAADGLITRAELPELDGEYQIVMRLGDETLAKKFVRRHYEWEHNTLGKTRTVYPPFTPIRVDGNAVETVLRRHELDGTGLPGRIAVKGVDILASPIVLKANGVPVAGEARFSVVEPDVAETESTLSAGSLSATARGHWEADGTLKYDLTLNPGRYDSLTLEIPLKNELAPMIHAMGVMRNSVFDFIPAGEGVVWDATKAVQNHMPMGFSPYVFVGSGLRGLCFFAENDRNWNWDRSTPNIELIRSGDVLTMKVNLINKPVTVTEPQTLSFGLLAAPVKPRIENWRTVWRDRKLELFGTCINWLGWPGNDSNLYPSHLYMWELFKKNYTTGGPRVTDAERQQAIKDGIEALHKITTDLKWKEDMWVAHVNHRLNSGADVDVSPLFYYNRAVFSGLEEYETFVNEWVLPDFVNRDAAPGVEEIKIVPSESYTDFAVYWYWMSFKYGNNGVYWDNYFICPSFNQEMTDAYTNADGTITPAAGLWDMRAIIKRTFQMMNEEKMTPFTFPHMTSTSILPTLSHATIQYDWEWNFSTGPVQNRFTRPYCILLSNGELAGVIPIVMHEHGPQTDDEFIQRTYVGVTMVHDLECGRGGSGKAWQTLFEPIRKAYFYSPEMKVVRYWDEGVLPVQAGNPDFAWILYSLPNDKAVLVVTSYDENPASGRFAVDLGALGLSGARAYDYESRQPVDAADGNLTVNLPGYGVAAVEFTRN